MDNTVKLFTHTDLDGVGCAILAMMAYPNQIDIEYCEPNTIDDAVEEFFQSPQNQYTQVYITDLSIQEDLAKKIDQMSQKEQFFPKLHLIDHHKTALALNQYSWVKVYVNLHDDRPACATYLFYQHLMDQGLLTGDLEFFAEKVRRLDTWDWERNYNDILAKQLSDLLYILGRDRFIQKYTQAMPNTEVDLFNKTDQLLLQLEEERITSYIDLKQKQLIIKEVDDFSVGVVFAEQYRSQLGNQLAKRNPNLDFIIMINPAESMSFRGIKDNIDLSEIAQKYGGGGHKMASGSPLDEKVKQSVTDLILHLNDRSMGCNNK